VLSKGYWLAKKMVKAVFQPLVLKSVCREMQCGETGNAAKENNWRCPKRGLIRVQN